MKYCCIRNRRWRILAVAGLLWLGACAGPRPVRVDIPPAPGAIFDFQDMRAAREREDRGRLDNTGNRIALGERDIEPPPAELFRAWFARKLPPDFAGRTVVLESFVVLVPAPIADHPTPVEVRIAGAVGGARFRTSATSELGNTTRADINATIVEALNRAMREATELLEKTH